MLAERHPIKSVHHRRDREPVVTSPNWKTRYAEIRPTYETYEKKLRELVTTVLDHAKIDVVQVEGRVKTVDSFAEKIGRKSGKYADPIEDMTDLVGLRIIAYYVEDVDRIVSLLRKEFDVLEEHSANKQSELAPDQFGYTSNHLTVRIGSRSAWLEWAPYAGIAVEFQVRTTLQHAWAAVNHKLSYKRVEEVPISLQRRLFRLSALFEMADEQFSAIRNAASELSDEYSDNVKQGNLDFQIDADSIDAYLQISKKMRRISGIAVGEFGVNIRGADRVLIELSRSDLIKVAGHLGARTIDEFDRLLPGTDAEIRRVLGVLTEKVPTLKPDDAGTTTPKLATFIATALHGMSREFFDSIYEGGGWEIFAEVREALGNRS